MYLHSDPISASSVKHPKYDDIQIHILPGYTPTEVNGRYGERQEGRAINDCQTLAWKNKHI
jgi:hypothetical protein